VSAAERELIERAAKQLRDNEAALRAARKQARQRQTEVEHSVRVAQTALRRLRAASG
jgi:hypothetical protein